MDGYVAKPLDPEELFLALRGIEVEATDVALAVFDESAALARIGDDELFGKLVALFLDECPQRMVEIREGITQRDGRAVERAAHNLKGAAAIFSAEAACRAAERLEAIGSEQHWAEADPAIRSLERGRRSPPDGPARDRPARHAVVKTTACLGGVSLERGVPAAEIHEYIQESDNVVWVDVQDPGPAEVASLEEEFGFHTLALEGAMQPGQARPVDEYRATCCSSPPRRSPADPPASCGPRA
jgi:HPt (histidine-containing phosphotransfer) domain-containing protein